MRSQSQVLSQRLPQREFIKRGLPLCGYSSLLLACPGSVIKGDSSGRGGLWARRVPTPLHFLFVDLGSCALWTFPSVPPPGGERGRCSQLDQAFQLWALAVVDSQQDWGWWLQMPPSGRPSFNRLDSVPHGELAGKSGGPGGPGLALAFLGHFQPLWQASHPHFLLGQCQVPLLLSPVTFTSWEVATQT